MVGLLAVGGHSDCDTNDAEEHIYQRPPCEVREAIRLLLDGDDGRDKGNEPRKL